MSDLRSALLSLYVEHGELTPSLVVQAAEPVDDPLHGEFEWDDTTAGHLHRLDQARRLIRRVKVADTRELDDIDDVRQHVREYISVQRGDRFSRSYQRTEDVLADPMGRAMLLRAMNRDWQAFKTRYSQMREFAELLRQERGDDGDVA